MENIKFVEKDVINVRTIWFKTVLKTFRSEHEAPVSSSSGRQTPSSSNIHHLHDREVELTEWMVVVAGRSGGCGIELAAAGAKQSYPAKLTSGMSWGDPGLGDPTQYSLNQSIRSQ